MDNLEQNLQIGCNKGSRNVPSSFEDVKKLSLAYHNAGVFREVQGRKYASFPQFKKTILSSIDPDDLHRWLRQKENEFRQLYS